MSQPCHKDMSSMFAYAFIWMKTAHPVCGWQAKAYASCIQRIFSKMVLRWIRGDELLNKIIVLFSLCRKSVLVASLNSDWTTDGRWTILTMLFILFWPWQWNLLCSQWDSHKPPGFHPKYLELHSEDKQSFYGFGMTLELELLIV